MEKELPKGWVETTIGNLATIVGGGTPNSSIEHYFEGDIGWVTPADLSKYNEMYISSGRRSITKEALKSCSARLMPKGTVLFSSRAPIGYVVIASGPISTNQGFKSLIPNNAYIPELAYYYLKMIKPLAESYASGTTFLELSGKKMAELPFPLPPKPEQERIVAKLDSLFAELELVKEGLAKIPVLMKNFRQAVLTQAVTGKLTEEWRVGKELGDVDFINFKKKRAFECKVQNEELKKSGRKTQKEIEPDFLYNDEKGWLIVTVESASLFIVDCLHNTPKFESEGFFVVDTTCISPFKINFDKARKVNSESYNIWVSRVEPRAGDLLFSREGTIGIAVKVPIGVKLCIGQRMMMFRFSNMINQSFSELYVNSNLFRYQYLPHIKGMAAQHLNIGDVRKMSFPIPSDQEQTEIVRRVEALFAQADVIEAHYKLLKEKIQHLPQTILAKAFRGELVEQLPTDGDAKELLEEIKKMKAGLVGKKVKGNLK